MWDDFYARFLSAVNRRDKKALLQMMPNGFFSGGSGKTANEWLQSLVEDDEDGWKWKDVQISFVQGTVIDKNFIREGIPTRVTKDRSFYFEFRKNKRWYFAGVVGD